MSNLTNYLLCLFTRISGVVWIVVAYIIEPVADNVATSKKDGPKLVSPEASNKRPNILTVSSAEYSKS